MNLLDVKSNGNGLELLEGTGLSGSNTKGQDRYKVGIRPEHLEAVDGPGDSDGLTLETTVNVMEPVGAESYVYTSFDGGAEIVVRVSSHAHHEPGEKLTLKAAAKDVHFFDAETGRRID